MSPAEPRPLPNELPRPPGELEELEQRWQPPKGWRILSAVNNTYVGLFYISAALLFLILGGVLALIMRTQLAVSENTLVDHDLYNQLFTMHGSVMMFLFAVPIVEAIGILLLPAMLGARDLPFPRLSAYAFWAYFVGGMVFFTTIFFDVAPDGGWFMYPPLTSSEYSPGLRSDFWLLGIGFIEISAIAGAIEIVVGILRTRPPGMTLDKMPVYVWAMLIVGAMIIFGFPPVILATALLELERAFDWPFFIAERGGDPVLWQHLFWLFGHPDVYIIFLPAAGVVSMIVPAMARAKLVGYRWVVLALAATGIISFALWVHHMFAIGMPHMTASFFSAASMAVAIPAGIQVFSWIATLRSGRVQNVVPTWFLVGFFVIFVLGGLTGVMLAVVPFDWQAHDTYFVVAHLHYVLIGGLVFPVFAAIYYWAPLIGGERLSERMGKWAAGLMFVGFNLAFFPLHIAGLLGMPRRVWTYSASLDWDIWNLLSTVGAFVLAGGFAIAFLDVLLHLRVKGKINANPWNAPTLEWLPLDNYAARSIPRISSRDPLWDNPKLREEVDSGQHYLPGLATGERETIVTSPIDARPQYLLRLPGPSWLPLLAGLGTAAFFLFLTVKMLIPSLIGGTVALVSLFKWLWQSDPAPSDRSYDIGDGIKLPDYMSGPRSHGWWATTVVLLVDGTVFACLVFSYCYFWTVSPGHWPPAPFEIPALSATLISCAAWAVASGLLWLANRGLRVSRLALHFALIAGMVLLTGSFALTWQALATSEAAPGSHAYGAVLYAMLAWQGVHVLTSLLMAGYTLARSWAGLLDHARRSTFDNVRLVWHYTVAQGILALLLTQLPRLAA
ncbi:MAG TPA: cbb3-type cytochrome c oxidase subunit I [Steroidobacter sp.]